MRSQNIDCFFFVPSKMAGWTHVVKRHIAQMKKHHVVHKKHFLKVFHIIRKHPGAYMAGYRPSTAAMPKTLPKKPAGLHKEASGLWDWAKKGWNWVKDKFSKHKGTIMEHAKKHATKALSHAASRVGAAGKRIGTRVLDKIESVAENNIDHYVGKAESKIEQLGKKAEAKLSKWDKKVSNDGMPGKRGSGLISTSSAMRRALSDYQQRGAKTPPWMIRTLLEPGRIGRPRRTSTVGKLTRVMKPGSGVFSRKFKRRSSAAMRAFRKTR